MKLKPIVLAMAATGLVAGQAHAFAPGTATDLTLYVSGATAQDGAFVTMFKDNFCLSDFDAFASGGTATAQRAFSCKLDHTKFSGMATDKTITVYKQSEGGSGKGVQPVADAVALAFMNVVPWDGVSKGCQLMASGEPAGFPVGHTYNCTYNASTDRQMHTSDAGLSDVEPALFVQGNVPAGSTDVTAAQLGKLDVTSVRVGVFGIPVTTNLRNALQAAQGLTVGAEDEANMPSLNRQEIASLMAVGGTKNWAQLVFNGNALTTYAGAVGSNTHYGATTKVSICRRTPGSGTQAAFGVNFLNYPCAAGSLSPQDTTGSSGPMVVLNSGAGDVDNCLDRAVSGTAQQVGTDAAGNPITAVTSKWAIGVQATEKNAKLDAVTGLPVRNYRFIKIDGVAPNNQNVWNNSYFDWVEESMQWRNAANAGPTGDMLTILQTVASEAGKPANTALTSVTQSWGGKTGYLTVPTTTYPTASVWSDASPINSVTRGIPVSNCRVPMMKTKLPN